MKQTNILLACAAGMSTSFIVSRMMESAMDSEEVGRIWAVPADDIEYESDYDIILLGPQISTIADVIRKKVDPEIPVIVIPQDLYGKCDGEAILRLALEKSGEKPVEAEPEEKREPEPQKEPKHPHLSSFSEILRNSFRMIMPLVFLGSVLSLLNGLPITAYQQFIETAGIKNYLTFPARFIYGYFSVYLAFAAGYQTARISGARRKAAGAGLFTILVYFLICPWDNYLAWTDQNGVFAAILCGLFVGKLFSYAEKKNWCIPISSLPQNLLDTYNQCIPGVAALVATLIVHVLFTLTPYGDFQNAITILLRAPLHMIGANLFGQIALSLASGILWFFGIHGGNVVMPIYTLLFTNLQMENLLAFQNGLPLPHRIIGYTLSIGNGSLPLVLCMLIFARSRSNRTISKTALIPSLFGVDEPAYYGYPMIMNPVFLVPWVLGTSLIPSIGTYLLQILGLLPNHSGVLTQFVPPFVTNFTAYGWAGVFWGFVLLAVMVMINYPFVKLYDRKLQKEEQEES